MVTRDLAAAGVLAITGLVAVNEARKLRLGSVVAPGPGFFPFCLALALSLIGVILVVQALRAVATSSSRETAGAGQASGAAPRSEGGGTTRGSRIKVAMTMTALAVYAFALEPIGFVLSTFALLLVFFRFLERHRWWVAVTGAAATAVVTYVVFKVWLQVRLPSGLLGF